MVGKIFQEFFVFPMNGERGCRLELFMRECFEGNGSARNGSKDSCKREAYPNLRGTVPYRTIPKSRVNAAIMSIRAERLNSLQWFLQDALFYMKHACWKIRLTSGKIKRHSRNTGRLNFKRKAKNCLYKKLVSELEAILKAKPISQVNFSTQNPKILFFVINLFGKGLCSHLKFLEF